MAYQLYAQSSAANFSFPNAVAWKEIVSDPSSPSSNSSDTVAILDGRCRIEIPKPRGTVVVVFDGPRVADYYPKGTNYPKGTPQYAQQLDPRPALQKLYAALPSPVGVPIERLGTNECWHFKMRGVPSMGVSAADVWVDTKTRFIRKISSVINGQTTTNTYELLPLDVRGQANRLFDPNNLQVLLPR